MKPEPKCSTDNSVADEENAWRAVLARDRGFDGTFVFAVRSTGIYCRPSCPARRPARELVLFYSTPKEAEKVGFSACRRCRPQRSTPLDPQVEIVREICRYIERNLDTRTTLATLSTQAGLSPSHLQRSFKRIMGVTPRQYADACRMASLKSELREGQEVTAALYDVGYGSSSRLYERSSSHLGMTPATYRRGGRGMCIGYSTVGCPFGRLLVAATERGICAVSLGDSDDPLGTTLREEFPNAEIDREAVRLEPMLRDLIEHMEGHQPSLDLPLDVQCTAFQWRVWQTLQSIPYGSKRSYGDVARALGQPSAVRAVARACATNPAAVLIPCHRVVREDGGLGGYRWGLERKRALLAQEARALPEVNARCQAAATGTAL